MNNINNNLMRNIKINKDTINRPNNGVNNNVSKKSFSEVLDNINKKEIVVSKHATKRLSERNVSLTKNDINRLDEAIKKASSKGIKDALVLMDEKAFILNIKNKTIITATVEDKLKENVFTNIDGAVII